MTRPRIGSLAAALGLMVLVAFTPSAAALDLLPDATELGAREALVIVRAAGTIRVAADRDVEAAVADGAFVRAPATLDAAGAPAWHGLRGAVEVRLRREDASREARIELDDGATGVVLEWPAVKRVGLPAWAALAGLGLAGAVARLRTRRDAGGLLDKGA